MVLVVRGVVLVVLEVVLVALGVVLVVLHGAQRQCLEQMFGADSVRNSVPSQLRPSCHLGRGRRFTDQSTILDNYKDDTYVGTLGAAVAPPMTEWHH